MSYQIEGRNSVSEAIKSERDIDKIYVLRDGDGRLKQIVRQAKEQKIVIIETDRSKLDQLSKTGTHQGIIAQCSATKYVSTADILAYAEERGEKPFVLIADKITDPHNMGAIIRTALAAGVHGIIIPKRRSVGINETVAKVAAGAVEHMKIAKVANLVNEIEYLKKQGVWIMGMDLEGAQNIYKSDLTGAIGVVIGSEGEGMSTLVRKSCDFLVKIPMIGEIQSLNASVAAGVTLFEILRQRSQN